MASGRASEVEDRTDNVLLLTTVVEVELRPKPNNRLDDGSSRAMYLFEDYP